MFAISLIIPYFFVNRWFDIWFVQCFLLVELLLVYIIVGADMLVSDTSWYDITNFYTKLLVAYSCILEYPFAGTRYSWVINSILGVHTYYVANKLSSAVVSSWIMQTVETSPHLLATNKHGIYHTDSNTLKLETVQRRSARRIMQNYNRHASVTTMLQHLDLPTLQQRRHHSKIIMLYRIRHQLANIPTTTSHQPPGILNTTTCHMPAQMYTNHPSSQAPSNYGTTYNLQ